MYIWKRPHNVPYPIIWSKFKGKREINGQIPKFWIQDIIEDQMEAVVKIILNGFQDEPICKYSHASNDSTAISEGTEYYKKLLTNNLGLVCMTEDSEGKSAIAGVGCVARISKTDPPFTPSGQVFLRFQQLMNNVYADKNPYEFLNLDEYLIDRGIYVLPEFRRQGICYELLRSWITLCKAVGQRAIMGSFTSVYSQRAAIRAGFQEFISIKYQDLEKNNFSFSMPGIQEHTEYLKVLYICV